MAIREVVRRLAMSRPDVAFTLAGEQRTPVTWTAALPGPSGRLARLSDILGAEFQANAIEIRGGRDGFSIAGFAALPTYTRANSLGQYLFVNGRPVRDKLLIGVVRAAPMPTTCHATGIRLWRSSSRSSRARSTSMCIRPRPRCVSVTLAWFEAS